jgi:ABC-type sugar transport system permease subunit
MLHFENVFTKISELVFIGLENYLYRNAFQYFEMGYASALAWILLVIALIMTMTFFKLSKKWGFED